MALGIFALEFIAFAPEFVMANLTAKSKLPVTKLMIFAMEDAS